MTRQSILGLSPNTQYALRVRAVNGNGNTSEWSRRVTFLTISDDVLPLTPSGLAVTAKGDAFHIEWESVTQNVNGDDITVIQYELQLNANTTRIVTAPQNLSANPTYDLTYEFNSYLFGTPQPEIGVQVRAVDNKGLKSDWTLVPVIGTNQPPTEPTNFVGVVGIDSISLSWAAATDDDVVSYEVYAGSTSDFAPTNMIFSGDATQFTYITSSYTSQYFKAVAVDEFGQRSDYVLAGPLQPESPFGSDTTAPPTPTDFAGTITNNVNGIGARADLSWTMSSPPSDLAGFYVRWKQGTSAYSYTTFQKDERTGTIQVPQAYAQYTFQIKAFDWSNNESAWSSVITVTAPGGGTPVKITGVTGTPTRDGIVYSWNASIEQNIKTYEVQLATDNAFTTGLLDFKTGSSTTLTASGLASDTTYYARVRAINVTNTNGLWSDTNTTTTLDYSGIITTVSADVITPGTLGAAGAGIINIGAGADLVFTGGSLKSNTFNGTSEGTSEDATAGFYLGNDGLIIADGKVRASALVSGVISGTETIELSGPNAIIQSENYDGSAGFRLSGNGLDIPDGSISARQISLQQGVNLVPPIYSDFELNVDYSDCVYIPDYINGSVTLDRVASVFNRNSLVWSLGENTTMPTLYLSTQPDLYNIPITENTSYIISLYAWAAVPTDLELGMQWSDGSLTTVFSNTLINATTPDNAQRVYSVVDSPSGVNGAILVLTSQVLTESTINIDGIQVEVKQSNSNKPSAWSPGTSTTINGGQITTGSIRSNNYTSNDPTQPNWSINMEGAATFSAMQILGDVVVGTGPDDSDTIISSSNYAETENGTIGWQLRGNGTADLRGLGADTIDASSITTSRLASSTVIELDGRIQATGDLGQKVQFDSGGFHVIGAYETPVISKSISASGIATIVTSSPHGYEPSAPVMFSNVGAPFSDGIEYVINTVVDAYTFTLSGLPAGNGTVTPITGMSYGIDTTGSREQPLYIDFPTTGGKPNIISGILSASTLSVDGESSFRNTLRIEPGAKEILAAEISNPIQAPSVSLTYTSTTSALNSASHLAYNTTDGKMYALRNGQVYTTSDGTVVKALPNGGGSSVQETYIGLIYGNNKWYTFSQDNIDNYYIIRTFDNSWNELDSAPLNEPFLRKNLIETPSAEGSLSWFSTNLQNTKTSSATYYRADIMGSTSPQRTFQKSSSATATVDKSSDRFPPFGTYEITVTPNAVSSYPSMPSNVNPGDLNNDTKYTWTAPGSTTHTNTWTGSVLKVGPSANYIPVSPNTDYTFSVYVKKGTTPRVIRCAVVWANGAAHTLTDDVTVENSWVRISATFNTGTGSKIDYFRFWCPNEDSYDNEEPWYFDAFLLERGATTGNYFDGDTPDANGWEYLWTGTAHDSISIARTSTDNITGGQIGWDYTNNKPIITYYNKDALTFQTKGITLDSNSIATGVGAATNIQESFQDAGTAFIARGSFDMARGDTIVIKQQKSTELYSGHGWFNAYDANGAAVPDFSFRPATTSDTSGAVWNGSRFISLAGGTLYTYESLDPVNKIGANGLAKYVAYSWYDSNTAGTIPTGAADATHESMVSPATPITLYDRAKLNIGISTIPSIGGVDSPNSARVYIGDSSAQTSTSWKRIITINYPQTTTILPVSQYTTASGGVKTVNQFAGGANTPGQIITSTGNAFFKGDGSAQFKTLTVTDSVTLPGPSGVVKVNGMLVQSGTATATPDPSSTAALVDVTFPVPFSAAPNIAATITGGTGAFAATTLVTATSVRIWARQYDNVEIAGNQTVQWVAMGPA